VKCSITPEEYPLLGFHRIQEHSRSHPRECSKSPEDYPLLDFYGIKPECFEGALLQCHSYRQDYGCPGVLKSYL